MALVRHKRRMGDILKAENIVTEEQIEEALAKAKSEGKKLGEILVELGYTTEESIVNALSRQLGIEVISLSGVQIEDEILNLVSGGILRKHMMVPIEYNKNNMNIIRVAMADPMDMLALDDFSIITNLQVEPLLATPHDISVMLDRCFGDEEALRAAERYAKERESVKNVGAEDE